MKKAIIFIIPVLLFIGGCWSQKDNEISTKDNSLPKKQIVQMVEDVNNEMWDKNEVKTTKQDCMVWCEMMWKWNPWNKDKLSDEMDRDCNSLCDAAQWMENNDISQCEKALWVMRDSCFTDVAKDLNQPDLCEKIQEPMLRNGCLTTLAEDNKDLSICDKITDPLWNWICKENVNNKEE